MRIDDRAEPTPNEQATMGLEPERDEAMSLIVECWNRLDSDRPRELVPVGMGFATIRGPIPSLAIDAWCRRNRLDDVHARLVDDVIQQLDTERSERLSNELATKG